MTEFHAIRRTQENRAARGFTLIEMMVSLAIVAGMILLANQFMVAAKTTVTVSQNALDSNAEARALAGRIRSDVQSMTREGFLVLTYRPATYTLTRSDNSTITKNVYVPCLAFTATGTFGSLLDTTIANAALVDYGLAEPLGHDYDDRGTPADATDDYVAHILFRRAMLQDPSDGTSDVDDHEMAILSLYISDRTNLRTNVAKVLFSGWTVPAYFRIAPVVTNPPSIQLPPVDLKDIEGTWPMMTERIQKLKIQWTDGLTDARGRLNWYDKDSPRDGAWASKDAAYQDANPTQDAPEFQYAVSGKPVYCAMWTSNKKDTWPVALRIGMTLGDPARQYELVLSVPR